MNPSFKEIANLFQAPMETPDLDFELAPRKLKGDSAQESRELGTASLSEGDWQTAIRHFQDAVAQRESGEIDSQMDLAGAFAYADLAPQALRQYERALRSQREAVEPHVGLSDIYKRYTRFGDCIRELGEAIRLDPGNAYLRLKLAETYRELGENHKAHLAAMGAVAAKPDEAFYHYWLGDLLIQMRRFDEALDSLRAALELSPGDDFLYFRAAVAFWGAKRSAEAIKAIRLASDLDPSKHLYYGLLCVLLAETGQPEDAELEGARAKKMDRYDRDLLARTLAEMGIDAKS